MKFPLFVFAALFVVAGSLSAQTAEQMIQRLQELREKTKVSQDSALQDAIRQINAAASSPSDAVNFFEEATRAVRFEGASRDSQRFRDWKEDEDDNLDAGVFRKALQLHLRHLALTLEASRAADPKTVAPKVNDLLPGAVEIRQELAEPGTRNRMARDMIMNSVGNGVFAQWMQLGGYLKPGKDWEMSIGNVQGVLTKMVRPPLIEAKSPQLIQTWDFQIAFEESLAEQEELESEKLEWINRRKPELLWNRAQAHIEIGQIGPGVNEMFAILDANKFHPSFDDWAEQLEQIIVEASNAQQGTEAPATDAPADGAPAEDDASGEAPTSAQGQGGAPVAATP